MTRHAIEIERLTKVYGEHVAVEEVSFAVAAGSVVGLLGPNGAGKTTTLKALIGAIRPTSGSVRVNARSLGFALDPPGMDPGHRARRHLEIAAAAVGAPRRRVDELIDEHALRGCERQRVRTLSTGQRQRLALATARISDPEILILDEPTNGLDAEGVRDLRHALRAHAAAGGTVLIASHMLFELEQIADEVVVLQQRVRYAGPLDALTGERSLEDAYFNLVEEARDVALV
jgi:ABC-2 type transport system ATP-binding protein